jgi:pimeloyl-ACP methyl ester carboxylesterase
MSEALINGFRMHYEVAGEGPPLVFVHGGFGGVETRLEQQRPWWVDEFAKHYTVVTYDRRGCGRSEAPDGPYYMETLVEDLRGLLAHLGIEQAHIMGSSAGGPIAMQFAATYQEMVRCLVLVNTAPDLLVREDADELRVLLEQREAAGPEWLPRVPVEADAAERERAERQREQVLALALEERQRAFAAWKANVDAYRDLDLSEMLWQILVPVYIIHGADDRIVPPEAAWNTMAGRLKHSVTRVRSGEGHGLLARRESEAVDYILEWLLERDRMRATGEDEEYEIDDPDPWPPPPA